MKNILILFMILGLGLSSCEKNSMENLENQIETISIDGKQYSKSLIYYHMSKGLGVPIEDLIFDPKTETFSLIGRDVQLAPYKYMDLSKF